jgi:uridylate kinase
MGAKYNRVLVKLSGEALRGDPGAEEATLSARVLTDIAAEIML